MISYFKYFFYLHRCKSFKDNLLTICIMEGNSSVTQSKYSDGVYSGHVKWFNRTAGWGFLTLTGEGETSGDDIFVHWNSLSVDKEQYRYLVNGEYVSFKITFNKDAKHPYQAEEVRGVNGGNLMCETRNEQLRSRPQNTRNTTASGTGHRRVNPRGRGPRNGRRTQGPPRPTFVDENGETWVKVTSRRGDQTTRETQ